MALGLEGRYVWSFDGERQTEGPAVYGSIVLGHQFHAQLLFFDALYGPVEKAEVEGRISYSGPRGHRLQLDGDGRPRRLVLPRKEDADIDVRFDGWRPVSGMALPFHVVLDDGDRTFNYRYRSVTFGEAALDELRAPIEALTDEQKLLRLHRLAMDAHLTGDAGMMDDTFGDEAVIVSAGEVHPTSAAAFRVTMHRILESRRYDRYDDLIRPVVRVSGDGSLGWVIARVGATGVLLDEAGHDGEAFEFTSAWISLFARSESGWKMIGNVSNFAPEVR